MKRGVLLTIVFLLALTLIVPNAFAARGNTTGLLRYYDADGSAVTTERFTGEYNLTASGATAVGVPGLTGNGYNVSHDGGVGYWTAGDTGLPEGQASGSLIAWVYYRSIEGGTNNAIAGYGAPNPNEWHYLSTLGNGTFQFQGNSGADVPTGNVSPTGQWVQVAYTYNGSLIRVYMNGVEVANATHLLSAGGTDFMIGQLTGFVDQGSNAIIDNVGLWSIPLGSDQIQDNYDAFRVTGVPDGYGYIVNGTLNGTVNTPPFMVSLSASVTANNQTLIVTGNATDADNATIRYYTILNNTGNLSNVGYSAYVAQGVARNYANISISQNGSYSVCAFANDGVVNSSSMLCTNAIAITFPVPPPGPEPEPSDDHAFQIAISMIGLAFVIGVFATFLKKQGHEQIALYMVGLIGVILVVAILGLLL